MEQVTANQDVTPTTEDVYLMVVVNASNVLKIMGRNADVNKAPMILATDIPVAMIKMTANSVDDAADRPIQYFTTDKTSNALTLMYDNSGVGAFAGKISSTASATTWQTVSDISFMNAGATTDIYIQDQANDAATGPSLNFRNYRASAAPDDYAGTLNFNVFDNGGADAPIGKITSKALSVAASNEFGDMLFSIANQNGTLVETLSLVGSAADVRVGVNKAAPESTLEIGGSFGATLSELATGASNTHTLGVSSSFVAVLSASGADQTLNLPALADCNNRIYHIKNDGSDSVIIDPNSSEQILVHAGDASAATLTLLPGQFAIIAAGAAKWRLMSKGAVA